MFLYSQGVILIPGTEREKVFYTRHLFIYAIWCSIGVTVSDVILFESYARVAKLVYALDLGSSRATCESSSLSSRTSLTMSL